MKKHEMHRRDQAVILLDLHGRCENDCCLKAGSIVEIVDDFTNWEPDNSVRVMDVNAQEFAVYYTVFYQEMTPLKHYLSWAGDINFVLILVAIQMIIIGFDFGFFIFTILGLVAVFCIPLEEKISMCKSIISNFRFWKEYSKAERRGIIHDQQN